MSTDQPLKGVVFAFAAFAAFAWSDASVKMIEGELDTYEMAFFGALFGLVGLPFLYRSGDRLVDIVKTTNRPLWLLRAIAAALGTITSVTAFTRLSMAEAFALIFLLPSFVTIMSVIFLKERVGLRRWSAVAIGFAGVLVILRPGFRELSIGHLAAIVAGLCGAISIIIYRAIGPTEKRISLYGAGIVGALVVCGTLMIPQFEMPTGPQWFMLSGFGLFAALATILLIHATNHAPAALVGPTQYSQMLWAVLIGYLVFGDRMDMPMLAGIALIIGSGLMTLARERIRGVALPPAVAADAPANALATVDIAQSD